MATEEVPFTFLGCPSLSYLQWPSHSPMFSLLSTSMRGMLACLARASTVRLYLGSSQSRAITHKRASLRSRALQTSLRPLTSPLLAYDFLITLLIADSMLS